MARYRKSTFRKYPLFAFPLDRFREQYGSAVANALVAEKMKNFGIRLNTAKALEHEAAAIKRAELFMDLFLERTGLKREQMGEKGAGTTNAVKHWFRDTGAPDVVFNKVTKQPKMDAAALTCWASDFPEQAFAAPAAALLGLRKAMNSAQKARAYYEVATKYDGRIHFDFNTIGTKGTRWSASAKFRWADAHGAMQEYKLNAQNVPSKASKYDFGPGYGSLPLMVSQRDCFEPDPGTTFCKFDFEGAEAALIAYYTQDELMMKWLLSGADFHTENAKLMFIERGIATDLHKLLKGDPNEDCRTAAKPATFGLAYQMPMPKGAKEEAPEHEVYAELYKQWKQMFPQLTKAYFAICIQRYWAGHSGIRSWQYVLSDKVARDGFVTLPQTGKMLYVSNTAKGRNMSANFPMQSGIGALISRATPTVETHCDWTRGGMALLLQVHDELDLQIPDDRVDDECGFVSEEMSKPADFGGYVAGVSAAPDVGLNWGKLIPWKKA